MRKFALVMHFNNHKSERKTKSSSLNDSGSEIAFVNMMILKKILDFSGSDDTAACCTCTVCLLMWNVN